jgi:hypothetical protein
MRIADALNHTKAKGAAMFDLMMQYSNQRRNQLMREAQRERIAREARAAQREAVENAQMRSEVPSRRTLELVKNQVK